jgi:uncharacterized membrane protein
MQHSARKHKLMRGTELLDYNNANRGEIAHLRIINNQKVRKSEDLAKVLVPRFSEKVKPSEGDESQRMQILQNSYFPEVKVGNEA